MAFHIALTTTCILAIGLIVIRFIRARTCTNEVEELHPECQPPRRYPHKEPLLGADFLLETAILIHQDRNLPALVERHDTLGKTYVVNSIRQDVFHTIDSENFRAVYETNWKDWGVAPARAEALAPFCGRGLINTDAEDWEHLKDLTKPAFSLQTLVDLSAFSEALDDLLD